MAQCFNDLLSPRKISEECHSAPFSGHVGRGNTLRKIKERFYWPDYHCLQDFILDMPFPCTAGFLGEELSPHLPLFLMFWGLCNCVTAFPVSSSAAGLSCTGLKCHEYYEFNTAKRSFIHVCLLIPLFSILVFGCLESAASDCGIAHL